MLRCGIIGAGAISYIHVEALQKQSARCEIVAVANRSADSAQKLVDTKELDAQIFTDYKKMVAEIKPDLVAICTPPSTHAEIASYCLERGIHTILEKPMAMSLAECDQILAARNKSGALLTVIAQLRYTGEYYRLKKLLDTGKLGRLFHIAVNSHYYRGDEYYYLDWRGRWSTEGGGCTFIHAIHFIDQLLWLVGKPKQIMSLMANEAHCNSEAEDISETIMVFENGLIGHLTSSLVHHGEEQGLSIQAEKAGVGVPFKVLASKARSNGFPEDNPEAVKEVERLYEKIESPQYQSHAGQINDFLNAIEGKETSYVTGEEGRDALELVHAIYKSAASGQMVTLPLQPGDEIMHFERCLDKMPHFHEKKIQVDRFEDATITISGEKSVEQG